MSESELCIIETKPLEEHSASKSDFLVFEINLNVEMVDKLCFIFRVFCRLNLLKCLRIPC